MLSQLFAQLEVSAAKLWSCTSVGACIAGFVHSAIPYLQVVALVLSIASAIKAWRTKK